MKVYDKNEVKEQVIALLNYQYQLEERGPWFYRESYNEGKEYAPLYSAYDEEIMRLKFAQLLLQKYNSKKDVTLSPKEIERFLIDKTYKTVYPSILQTLNCLGVDMEGVCLDGLWLAGSSFINLENVHVNLDKLGDKNLINTRFRGASFSGSFDKCKLALAIFENCASEKPINPQEVYGKTLYRSKLGGIEIEGSLDGVNISYTDFSKSKGTIVINPQKCINKTLEGVLFNNCYVLGDYDEQTGQYEEASFAGCEINYSIFKGVKNIPTIDIGTISYSDIYRTDLTGVRIIGTVGWENCGFLFSDCTINGEEFNLAIPSTYENKKLVDINLVKETKQKIKEKKSIFSRFKKKNEK